MKYFSNRAPKFLKYLFFIEQEPVNFGILLLSLDFMWLSAQLALISQVMKVLRDGSWPRWGRRFLDPLQVAFHPHLGIDDAAINAAICIWVADHYASLWGRIAFLESHSAFDTIQLLPLGEKLCGQCNDLLGQWLPHRQATGRVSGQCDSVLSDVVVNDTGAPLLPFLFSLYTTEGRRCLHSHYGSKRRWWGIWRATNTYEWW